MLHVRKLAVGVVLAAAAVTGAGVVTTVAFADTAPDSVTLPADKQKIVDDEAKEREDAARTAESKSTLDSKGLASLPIDLPARTAGIVDMHQGPFPGGAFRVENVWQGSVGGTWYLVYAGGVRDDDGSVAHGGVRVYSTPADPNDGDDLTFVGEYTASSTKGTIEVTSVSSGVLTLSTSDTTDDKQVRFDVAKKAFK